jgi:hypothetical protein
MDRFSLSLLAMTLFLPPMLAYSAAALMLIAHLLQGLGRRLRVGRRFEAENETADGGPRIIAGHGSTATFSSHVLREEFPRKSGRHHLADAAIVSIN